MKPASQPRMLRNMSTASRATGSEPSSAALLMLPGDACSQRAAPLQLSTRRCVTVRSAEVSLSETQP